MLLPIRRFTLHFTLLCTLLLLAAVAPGRIPIIDPGDIKTLRQHFGRAPVIVAGTVQSAEWSKSGKVMNIEFVGADGRGLLAVVFENRRRQFDEAWAGDLIKTIAGKRVRLYGQVNEYGGYDEVFRGRPQMILNSPEQVTLPAGLEPEKP